MDKETLKLYEAALWARTAMKAGDMKPEDAYEIARRYVDHANEKGKEIAKRFKMKPSTISLSGFMR